MFAEAAESLGAPKLPLCGPRSGSERLVPEPLVRSLPVGVLTVFSNSVTPRRFAEEHHPVQTLGRDRQHKALRVSVAVRGLPRGQEDLHAYDLEDVPELPGELRVAVADHEPVRAKEPSLRIGQVLATCAMKAPSGVVVRPAMWARRVFRSMRKRM